MAHHRFSDEEVDFFRKQLLLYYKTYQRNLPWRNLANTLEDVNQRAYSVWVSEIMLQQTQVATVIDYYNRWIKRWPTVADLSRATLEEVNEMWSGLGYYSRGRKLHEGAQTLMKKSGKNSGEMPQTAKELMRELSGVGRYTAGAIASIAYQQVTGVVDGNVIRVLSRLRMIGADTSMRNAHELFWELAERVVDRENPGDFNQAMMDLGATICTPKSPQCSKCPLNKICKSYYRVSSYQSNLHSSIKDSFSKSGRDKANAKNENNNSSNDGKIHSSEVTANTDGDTGGDSKYVIDVDEESSTMCEFSLTDIEDVPGCAFCLPSEEPWRHDLGVANLPRKPKKRPPAAQKFISVIIEHDKQYLFVQRPEKGLLAGMWEFPMTEIDVKENNESIESEVAREEIKRRFHFSNLGKFKFYGEVNHVFSHRFHIYRVYHTIVAHIPCGVLDADGRMTMWLTREQADKAAITTGIKKIMQLKDTCVKDSGKRKRGGDVVKGQKTLKEMFAKKTKV